MADENAQPLESRIPLPDDLVKICRELNAHGAKYMVVGGFAVIQHGYLRNTGDINVLIEDSPENQIKTKRALEILPDKAIRQLGDDDLRDWVVVRVCARSSRGFNDAGLRDFLQGRRIGDSSIHH